MKTITIISESEAFSMGFDYENGHKYGKDIEYSDGSIIREITNSNGVVIDSVEIR